MGQNEMCSQFAVCNGLVPDYILALNKFEK